MIELLKKVKLFENLNVEQLQRIQSIARTQTFTPGTVLFQENDHGAAFYILLKGSIKIYTRSSSGDEKVLSLIQAGESFGELSLLDGRPRSASAQTLEGSTLLVISANDFHALLREQFEITRHIMTELCRRLRDTNQHVYDLTFVDSRTRVLKNVILLANRHGSRAGNIITIKMPLNYDELAQMAGVAKQALSQVLRDLEDRQILTFGLNEYKLDLARLNG
ncbi:Crp/Fnr family transcriptional regulator [Paenibacillus sp. CF384]|uniref:Crp/Fnr family transcriptional regulator n=1 Tax=Paenibacillus sp. CF384 TaxID=1884382 RepID=UPI00089493B3|nr:Crp/Fnr family transcriptional regulator [Paenibacillus sp. CF384]SDX40262.1 CRP/FNR family transcriptional regulator, anaerobic regulatory protein [Paenibacillus sp. CF384]